MPRAKRLRRVCDGEPGIRREQRGEEFIYLDPEGQEIVDPEGLARIRSLAIPPAYRDVWICPHADGHIQATGRDARGRKQYRYHPEWERQRGESKFGHMLAFGHALPGIRDRVARDLRRPGLPRAKVIATIVSLLGASLIRVGNEGYARDNHSYGLTTLRDRHVAIHGATLAFSFRGKHGIRHRISVHDRRLAGIVQRSRDLPGSELFQYIDRRGKPRHVRADDVNDYLRTSGGDDFTAKDFRTWSANVLLLTRLLELGPAPAPTRARRHLREAIASVAERLGNTPTVCRRSYIHPTLIGAYEDNSLFERTDKRQGAEEITGLGADEMRLLAFLEATACQPVEARGANDAAATEAPRAPPLHRSVFHSPAGERSCPPRQHRRPKPTRKIAR